MPAGRFFGNRIAIARMTIDEKNLRDQNPAQKASVLSSTYRKFPSLPLESPAVPPKLPLPRGAAAPGSPEKRRRIIRRCPGLGLDLYPTQSTYGRRRSPMRETAQLAARSRRVVHPPQELHAVAMCKCVAGDRCKPVARIADSSTSSVLLLTAAESAYVYIVGGATQRGFAVHCTGTGKIREILLGPRSSHEFGRA